MNKYTLKQFMCDFIALWRNPEFEKLKIPPEGRPLRNYFLHHYGDDAEAFGALHMKVVKVVEEYAENHRPNLINRQASKVPDSLLIGAFYLIAERGIENPTREQIEAAEANQSPTN